MARNAFGSFFKELRQNQGITLRQFCLDNGFDPGNLSKMERRLLPPPSSETKLKEYAKALKIRRGSEAWYQFFDLARTATGRIPPELMRNRDVAARLPLLFRTLRGQKVSEKKLNELIKLIRQS